MEGFLGPKGPIVLGHRGCVGDAPENTLGAFREALTRGALGVECDVRLTADGTPIIFHDADLARMTGGVCSARLDELDSAALSQVVLTGGEPVPTLSRVLDWAEQSGALLNLELKGEERAETLLQAVTVELARSRLAMGRIVLSCFEYELAQRMRRRLPGYAVALLCTGETERVADFLRSNAGTEGIWLVNAWLDTLDVGFEARVRAAGGRLGVWGIDTPEDLSRLAALLDAGLDPDLLISDEPGLLLERLKRRERQS